MADWVIDDGVDIKQDYTIDWAPLENGKGDSNWLDRTSSPVESISSQTTVSLDSPGLNVISSSLNTNNTQVSVRLNAANCAAGQNYRLKNTVTTSTGQVVDRIIIVRVTTK